MRQFRLFRAWSETVEQLQRDAVALGRRLRGVNPSPLVKGFSGRDAAASASARPRASGDTPKTGAVARGVESDLDWPGDADLETNTDSESPASDVVARGAAGARSNARELVVERVERQTDDAVTLVLTHPKVHGDGETNFDFLPGQFFTVLTMVDGLSAGEAREEVPRNYSASNVPGTRELHLTLKVKPGGRVSPELAKVRVGERLRVLGPFGSFVLPRLAEGAARRVLLVAGGAGITPLASIAQHVLSAEPEARVALIYGNRRDHDVILRATLDGLAADYRDRFSCTYMFEQPSADGVGLAGRLDKEGTLRALATVPLVAHPDTVAFVCGPDAMREEVVAALAQQGVPDASIFVERFSVGPRPHAGTPTSLSATAASSGSGELSGRVTLRVRGRVYESTPRPGDTLLEAARGAGAPMPFSCGVGGCGACRAKLVTGEVVMDEPNCLSAAERDQGYILTCVGRALGDCLIDVEPVAAPVN